LNVSEWIRQGRWLGTVARAGHWWLGDWLRYGNTRYGEGYRAAAEITGYDVQTLMNIVYVVSRFELTRRRQNLSFTHHAELAALPKPEQDEWLDRAERESLSVRALRAGLRQASRLPLASERTQVESVADGSPTTLPAGQRVLGPTCGQAVSSEAGPGPT
jgi:hypothetical protein